MKHPVLGTTRTIGPVVKFSETPACVSRPASGLGEHTAEVAAELGRGDDTAAGTPGGGAR